MSVKFKDVELGEVIKAREPYATHDEYYMKIRCIYEGSNAVRIKDGRTIQFNNLTDVTKVEVDGLDLVEYIDEQKEQTEE